MDFQPTEEGKKGFKIEFDFFAVIGRFITSYAAAECAAHVALRSLSSLSDSHARIIFAGMRFTDINEKLRKLSVDHPLEDEINCLLTQLGAIGKERDRIAHRFTYIDQEMSPPRAVVSNHWNSKVLENSETRSYTAGAIANMMFDCDAILLRFKIVADGRGALGKALEQHPRDLFAPWLYIPPEQGRKRQENPESS